MDAGERFHRVSECDKGQSAESIGPAREKEAGLRRNAAISSGEVRLFLLKNMWYY